MFTKTEAISHTRQLTEGGKLSFKILDDVGAEYSLSQSDTDTTSDSTAKTWRVLEAKEELLDHPPA